MTRAEAIKKGKKTYDSGTLCPLNHKAKRYVTSRRCVKCDVISSKLKTKTKDSLAKTLANLSKYSAKKIEKMIQLEFNYHTLKIALVACAGIGIREMEYKPSPEIDELLKAEGLEIRDNKIIW